MLKAPSIHLKGSKDKFAPQLTIEKLFFPEFNPLVIPYDDGHRFPRSLSDESFSILKNFVREQFKSKNGGENGFEVDYESYNFEVKINAN